MIDELRVQTLWFGKSRGLVVMEQIDDEYKYTPLNGTGDDYVDLLQKYDIICEACIRLTTRQQQVVKYITNDITQKEIAFKLGVTESRVSQIYKEAIRRIKEYVEIRMNNEGVSNDT
jgi:RNA polymerase sigma factor (sigma-70 family)